MAQNPDEPVAAFKSLGLLDAPNVNNDSVQVLVRNTITGRIDYINKNDISGGGSAGTLQVVLENGSTAEISTDFYIVRLDDNGDPVVRFDLNLNSDSGLQSVGNVLYVLNKDEDGGVYSGIEARTDGLYLFGTLRDADGDIIDLQGYVPYTGASQDLNMGNQLIYGGGSSTTEAWKIYYVSDAGGTLRLAYDENNSTILQGSNVFIARNAENNTFTFPTVAAGEQRYLPVSVSVNGDTPVVADSNGNIDLGAVGTDSIPLAGTAEGSPVTGDIGISDAVSLKPVDGGGFYIGDVAIAAIQIPFTGNQMNLVSENAAWAGPQYDIDRSANYTNRSLVDKGYVDGQINALPSVFRPVGNWDASGGTFPTIGSGTAGAIRRGDTYNVSVAGTMGGKTYDVGDNFYANVATPGQTSTNWSRFEENTQQANSTTRGTVRLYTGTGSATDGGVDQNTYTNGLAAKENTANKQNSLAADGTGTKFPTVDTILANVALLASSNVFTVMQSILANLAIGNNSNIQNAGSSLRFNLNVGSASSAPTLTRNTADAVTTFIINNANASNTGQVLELQSGGTTVARLSKTGDVEVINSTAGIILRSPNNSRYRVTVSDAGVLTTTLI